MQRLPRLRSTLANIGARAQADAIGRELLTRWSEPHRRYHTLDHLDLVLSTVEDHIGSATDPEAVRLAAWFHDAVYDPQRLDNEESSAALTERMLDAAGVPGDRVMLIARLVRLTASHEPASDDLDGQLLCDADLAILASDPATYRSYVDAVRAEYAHVPDTAFRAGRAAVLRGLLALPALYRVPALHAEWEKRARHNIKDELAQLGGNL